MDAFNLFQDICLLTNGDKANWLPQTPKMNKILGLELIEATLKNHTDVFLQVRFLVRACVPVCLCACV